jgi:hypothetical protein
MLLEHLSLTPGSTKSSIVGSTNTNAEGRQTMTTGVSIHIGLNRVDPAHYRDENGNPWEGALPT